MKVYYATLFFCENLITAINAYENKSICEYHLTEFDRTFQNGRKKFEFKNLYNLSNIKYHKIHLGIRNVPVGKFGKLLCCPYRFTSHRILAQPQWHNDGLQRNLAQGILPILEDDDIVILSDVDEMILNEYFDELLKLTLQKQIITIKMYFTMFYFNLYSINWGGQWIIRIDCF